MIYLLNEQLKLLNAKVLMITEKIQVRKEGGRWEKEKIRQ